MLAGVGVPDAGGFVGRSGDNTPAVAAEDGVADLLIIFQLAELLAGGGVPDEGGVEQSDEDAPAVAADDDPTIVGGELQSQGVLISRVGQRRPSGFMGRPQPGSLRGEHAQADPLIEAAFPRCPFRPTGEHQGGLAAHHLGLPHAPAQQSEHHPGEGNQPPGEALLHRGAVRLLLLDLPDLLPPLLLLLLPLLLLPPVALAADRQILAIDRLEAGPQPLIGQQLLGRLQAVGGMHQQGRVAAAALPVVGGAADRFGCGQIGGEGAQPALQRFPLPQQRLVRHLHHIRRPFAVAAGARIGAQQPLLDQPRHQGIGLGRALPQHLAQGDASLPLTRIGIHRGDLGEYLPQKLFLRLGF